jgi:[protein-PII] uridylyltransferase
VWNNWRGMLVTELYVRAREFFERGEFVPEDRGARANRVRSRVRGAAGPTASPAVDRLVDTMPDSYFLSTPEDAIAEHAAMLERLLAQDDGDPRNVVVHRTDAPSSATRARVRDARPAGPLRDDHGRLAAEGLNILRRGSRPAARASRSTRSASRPSDEELDPDRAERLEATLRAVLGGEVEVEPLVERSARPWLRRKRGRQIVTTIDIDNDVSDAFTVLDVTAGDRVGLLFTITNSLYRLGVDIHLAKVTTMVTQALDAFYVTEQHGWRKIEDPRRLDDIRSALLQALEPASAVPQASASGG